MAGAPFDEAEGGDPAVRRVPEGLWRPASFFRSGGDALRESGGVLTCSLCPFECRLRPGDTGRCHVRRRRGDHLETATFATTALHVHPIERKPFYHVRPGSRVLTLAAPGCTFACTYCQNYRLSQFGRTDDAPWTGVSVAPESVVTRAANEGLSIAFSYSEPVLAAELTLALAPLAKAAGVPLLWKTNGFVTEEAAREVAPALTAANVDLKAPGDEAHIRLTGAPVTPVVRALEVWREAGVWLEISTPVIPGFNDDVESLGALARILAAVGPQTPWHLLRFHPDYRLNGAPPTHPDLLERAGEIARAEGLVHVYVERALGDRGRATRCAGCGEPVIERRTEGVRDNRLRDGRCPHCHVAVAGCW